MSCFTLVAGQLSIACDRTRHAFLERQNAAHEYHRVFILPPNCKLGLCRLWLRCRKNGCVLSWDAYPGWPGGADADICWLSAVLPMPQKYPQWRPYSKRTMSSVRTPFVHSPVPTNSWEFRKSSPCRPFDVLPNVNATNSWTFFFTKFRQYARIMLHLGLRFNGPICLHIRKLEMQFQMYTQEFPNNDSVGFQSLGRGVVSGRMQPWNLGSLQPWNPVTLEVWILARQT